jgi:hypothetical protein
VTVPASVSGAAHSRGLFWAAVPVVLLVFGVGGVVVLGTIAANDPGFRRAVEWDRQQAQSAENARLGYHVVADVRPSEGGVEVIATIVDPSRASFRGAEVEAEAFANARAGMRRTLRFVERADGTYGAELGTARPGLWELRFTVVRGGQRYTEVVRVDVPGSAR